MATDLQAEEPCTWCGHAAGWHKHADECRFGDCICLRYDGPGLSYGAQMAALHPGPRVAPRRNHVDDHTARDGKWPASMGRGEELRRR